MAQSQYISYEQMGMEDRQSESLQGKGGVLILSKVDDLVITIKQDESVEQENRGINADGLYEYVITTDCEIFPIIKVEVSRRGDPTSVNFTESLKANYLKAYFVETVEKPITLKDNTSATDATLDESLAVVEMTSEIADLQIKQSAILGAKLTKETKKQDESLYVYTLQIPIAPLKQAREKMKQLRNEYDVLNEKLQHQKGKDEEYDRLDNLEEEIANAENEFAAISQFTIFAEGTNRISIDISQLEPRSKKRYNIILLKQEVEVSDCNRMLREGGNLFARSNYKEAREAYLSALNAKDKKEDQTFIIRKYMAQCDSCIKYEDLLSRSIIAISNLKKADVVNQEEVANQYYFTDDILQKLISIHPTDFYSQIRNKVTKFLENMPLYMRFYTVKWEVGRVAASENGPMSGVEIWAYYGTEQPQQKDYRKREKFEKRTKKDNIRYQMMGMTDTNGIVDVEMTDRKNLPLGFFFNPTTVEGKTDVYYIDLKDVMAQAKGEYKKRQFRMKIYTRY